MASPLNWGTNDPRLLIDHVGGAYSAALLGDE